MGVLKISDHNQFKINMPNPNQDPPASSEAQNQDFMYIDVLCAFNIKIERQDLEQGYIKDQ